MPDDLYSQAVQDYVTGARAATASGLEGSPDDAARTVQLESATGVPSQVIAPDLEAFEQAHQTALATHLVSQNPKLMAYVHSHPMAAGVSADDWGAMDKFSRGATQTAATLGGLNLPWQRAASAGVQGAVAGFKEGFGGAPEFFPQATAAGNLLQSASVLGQVALKAGSGIFGAVTQGAGEAVRAGAEGFGMSRGQAEKLGRDIQAMTEYHMITPGGDWAAAHEEPPRGVNQHVDQAKAEINAHVLEQVEGDLKAAQASATKERSPEMFQRFAEQHYGDATISIHGDAALALYGDKLPEPNDGLLGWVPGISDKLESAKLTGADVEIPVADWMSKVDPGVAKTLRDDIRVWPGGITAREAGELEPPTQMVDSPLAQVRGASGLEPVFSMGDRKLTLQQIETVQGLEPGLFNGATEAHIYKMLDENGAPVGDLELYPTVDGKTINVGWIGGQAGLHVSDFGPSLMRDLMRQVKALYPDAERLVGERISGARKAAGISGSSAEVKLNVPIGWDQIEATRGLLTDVYRPIDAGVEANIAPSAAFLAHEKQLSAAIHDELAKITGGRAKVVPTAGIRYGEAHPRGIYFPRSSLILYDLLDDDPVGTGRHEAIHFLRDQGLFSDREWATLKEAAMQEDWLGRYHIPERWARLNLTPEKQFEESIAEAFREWASAKEGERRQYSPVAQIFQKLWNFLQGLKGRFAEIFGHVPTAEELFSKVSSGEIGERAAQGSSGGGPLFSAEDLDNLKASGLGLDLKSFQRIQKLVQERHASDVEAAQKSAEREQARRQTKEWKDNKAEVAKDVEATIRQRPDVAADLFLGSGELYGEKLRQRFTLRSEDLTPEQRASLPAHYVSRNGLPVDEVGRLFGYQSGDAMVDHLAAYTALKGDRSPQEMLRHVVDLEADRQMEAKYGNLAQNILTEAKDQALAKNDLNLLTEEYHAAALQAGVTAVDKDTIAGKARDIVNRTPLSEVNFDKQMTLIGRHYRDAVRSLVNGDPASAVISLEKRTLAAHVASEMKKVQTEKGKFEALAKRYAKPWDPARNASVEPNFSLFTRDILAKAGMRYGMSVPGLAKAIGESGYNGLLDFVTKTEAEGRLYGLELPVPDWLLNPGPEPKRYPTLSVSDFHELRDAVTTMDKVGRADQKIIKAGEAQDRANWIKEATDQLKEYFEPIPSDKKRGLFNQAMHTFVAVSTSNETLMSRFDHRDMHGIFTETITKPGAEAANTKARLQRETAAEYRALGEIKDADKLLDSPFIDPRTNKPLTFTRRNLATVISNMGNNYNWSILAKGWKVDPDALMKWVEANSTAEDIERAQVLGNIFKGLKAKADVEYQHLYGVAPENIVPRPFTMHGKQFEGWYHPIIGDPQLSRFVNKMPDTEVEQNFWPSTSNSYMKRRTGAVQVIDLTYDSVPARLDQVIHDISFRRFVANTAKIFKDTGFRSTVRAHYGKEYMEEMDQWLQRIAGDSSYNTGAMQLASKLSNSLRQNVITTAIAFNIGTIEKHGLTAALMSARELSPNLLRSVPHLAAVTAEVAPSLFKRAVNDLFGLSPALGDSLFDFIKKNSEEIQRRERNFLDTVGGQQGVFEGKNNFRQQLSQWGAKGVAFSDMLSAAPLWLAKYRAELEANGGIHGDAVREADFAVRRAHGSTAVTNLPRIAANSGPITPWLTSLYGFMGTSMQRRIEIFHDINDAYKLGMGGDIRAAAKMVPTILSSTAVYVLYTGAIEELITGQFTDDRRGLGSKALTFLFGTVAQSIIGLRDLVYDLESGRESAGLVSTPLNDLVHLKRDLSKHQPLSKGHAGQLLQDGCTSIGDLFGVCPKHLGTIAHYGLDTFDGFQHPRTGSDIYRGVVTGKQRLKVER